MARKVNDMHCTDFEKLIYLYWELDRSEKSRLEKHLETCAACSALYASVRQSRENFRSAGPSIQSEEKNPFLVNKIMSGLRTRPRASLLERFFEKFDRVPVRYAFAIISIVLLITFFQENSFQQSLPGRVARVNEVKIDASTIHRRAADLFRTDKGYGKFSFLECLKICEVETGPECSDCVTKKLNQN